MTQVQDAVEDLKPKRKEVITLISKLRKIRKRAWSIAICYHNVDKLKYPSEHFLRKAQFYLRWTNEDELKNQD